MTMNNNVLIPIAKSLIAQKRLQINYSSKGRVDRGTNPLICFVKKEVG
jgi:hypothetical protein